ncbi:MAG: translation initiation factor IF-2 [Desulfotalea sp.]
MSRIRIYELAKEAGMTGGELAEKLIKKGYQIKGHSSTVDDSTASDIRNFLKTSKAVEKKKAEEGTARTTIIRRKKADKPEPIEEPVVDAPATTDKVVADQEEKVVADKPVDVKKIEGKLESQEAAPKKDEEVKKDSPAVEAENAPATKSDDSTPKSEGSKSKTPEQKKSPVTAPKAKIAPTKNGAARIVGRVELPIPTQEPSRPRRKPNTRPKPNANTSRPNASRPTRPNQPSSPKPPTAGAPPTEDSRSRKKKGKRTDEGADRDRNKVAKRGKKGVRFTHFDNDYSGRGGRRGKKKRQASPQQPASEMKASKKRIKVFDTITVGEFASRMRIKAGDVIGKLMALGVMVTINQSIDTDTAMIIAEDYGYEVEQGITEEIGIQRLNEAEALTGEEVSRSPVVTVMGHVDHGKTSILDAIRKTDVADGEAGGITQHIGAYHVKAASGDVTFVDTPGHAAFTEMRSRGAQITDIVILVVAADDGVMDQTREAIRHSQAANVPIIVAVNKIDKDNADVDRVKRELAELDLSPEEWGGQTMYYETSAKQQIGIDELMEGIQLMAEVLELKADPKRKAIGRVIEAQLHKGRGSVATILVQAGTLSKGDHFVVGQYSGKVRAMLDYKGRQITEAGPAIPVEVQGLTGVPSSGDEFVVVTDEKMAKSVSQDRAIKARENVLGASTKISLDKLFEQMSEGDVKELRVVLRSDVQGTLEAFAKAAADLSTKQIKVRVLHEGTGTITVSDILLASASDAIIIGFNVRPSAQVKELAVKEAVDVRSYDVIYHALDDIRDAMVGMLDPTFEEEVIGDAEVRDIFSVPKIGAIGGCYVQNGKIQRNAGVRVLRDGVVIYTGKISSLRRFKDDAKEVLSGYECGIGVENFNDIKIGDVLEAFVMNEVEAKLI